jgi:hypothetical protein
MTDPIRYYLAVYDWPTKSAAVLALADLEEALIAHRTLRREKAEQRRKDVDVPLVGADSLVTLEKLHTTVFTTATSLEELERPIGKRAA